MERLEGCLENEEGTDRITEAKEYILSNWIGAKLRLRHQNGVKGSSTEGHVSEMEEVCRNWSDTRKKNFPKRLELNMKCWAVLG